MKQDEAGRLHEGLRRSFAELFGCMEDARLEDRAGYRLVVCPRVPFPGLNGIWAEDADEPAAVHELERAINEVEGLGVPCWIEVRAGRTPAFERAARRLGFTHEDSIPGMVVRPAELTVVPGPEPEVTRVRDAAGLAVAATVAAAGFEVPREHFAALFTPRVATTTRASRRQPRHAAVQCARPCGPASSAASRAPCIARGTRLHRDPCAGWLGSPRRCFRPSAAPRRAARRPCPA